jgi:hypothetical protein
VCRTPLPDLPGCSLAVSEALGAVGTRRLGVDGSGQIRPASMNGDTGLPHLETTSDVPSGNIAKPGFTSSPNSIDTIFDKRSERPVRDARAAVVAHATTPRRDETDEAESVAWNDRLSDVRVDLYQRTGTAVVRSHHRLHQD